MLKYPGDQPTSEDQQSEKNTENRLSARRKRVLTNSGCRYCGSSGCCDGKLASNEAEEPDRKDGLQ